MSKNLLMLQTFSFNLIQITCKRYNDNVGAMFSFQFGAIKIWQNLHKKLAKLVEFTPHLSKVFPISLLK